MTPARLKDCLLVLGWSQRGMADMLCVHETRIRRWVHGVLPVPDEVAAWLETLTAVHVAHKAPVGWRREAA